MILIPKFSLEMYRELEKVSHPHLKQEKCWTNCKLVTFLELLRELRSQEQQLTGNVQSQVPAGRNRAQAFSS